MYNDKYVLDSRRVYPMILRSGSVPFSKGNASITINVTELGEGEDYLIAISEGGYIRRPSYYDLQYNGSNFTYVENGVLKLMLQDFAPRSGIVYWRVYARG